MPLMELTPIYKSSSGSDQRCAEKRAGISNEIPASLGETPEGDASFASQIPAPPTESGFGATGLSNPTTATGHAAAPSTLNTWVLVPGMMSKWVGMTG
jgi:hypothetical protein